jgi:ribosome-binding factor A
MRIRPEKVAHRMRREIAEILQSELRDPRLGAMLSVTDVEVTHDLSFAKVYVSALVPEAERTQAMEALRHAAGFVRRALGPRMGLREVPEIRFVYDDSLDRGARVDELLRRIGEGERIEDDEERA